MSVTGVLSIASRIAVLRDGDSILRFASLLSFHSSLMNRFRVFSAGSACSRNLGQHHQLFPGHGAVLHSLPDLTIGHYIARTHVHTRLHGSESAQRVKTRANCSWLKRSLDATFGRFGFLNKKMWVVPPR